MDDVGVENSELEPQVPASASSGEATPEDEPRLWEDVPEVDGGEASAFTAEKPEAAHEGEPKSDPEHGEALEAEPVDDAPLDEPVQPTLDEMVASIAVAAATPAAAAGDAAAVPVDRAPVADAEDAYGEGEDASAEPAEQAAPTEALDEVAAEELDEPAAEEPIKPGVTAPIGDAAAPEDAADEPAPTEPVPYALRLPFRVPFWIEFAVFGAFVAAMVYLLWPASTGPFVTLPLYAAFVLGGAALVVVDLVTALAVWLSARSGATDDEKVGLGRVLWMRALAWTAGGVALWWIGIALLELHRTGVLG